MLHAAVLYAVEPALMVAAGLLFSLFGRFDVLEDAVEELQERYS